MTNQAEPMIDKNLLRRAGVCLIVGIWVLAPYLILQQFALYDVFWLEQTWLDDLISWQPWAVYVYFSYYFFVLCGCLSVENQRFVKLLRDVCIVVLISHLTFFFFPTGVSRESIALEEAPTLYQWLVSWEKPRNCLPSLHASIATLVALAFWSHGRFTRWIAVVWWLAILWSTLALKQHLVIDATSGVILGCIVWFLPLKLFRK